MACKDLINLMKKMSVSSGDSESNSLWNLYYSQYLDAISIILYSCDEIEFFNLDEVFVPLCFLVSHYMELWAKTIFKNFGIGNFNEEEAVLVPGHDVEIILARLSKKTFRNSTINPKILHINDLYKEFKMLARNGITISEAMRYPIDKKDLSTLSQSFSDELEWQSSSFDFCYYKSVIENLISETSEIYDLVFQEKIH